jgi:caffeoyl-CoA O-methyltransferase
VITNPEIERYIRGLLPPRDEVLAAIEAQAARRKLPIVGPVVGRLLAQLAAIAGARRIFEMGSAIGYSTIWLARAAGEGGEVHYTDRTAENAAEAAGYFERAGVSAAVKIHVGDAFDALAGTSGEFDLIFNDVDKEDYPRVLEAVRGRLKKGGLFISDNTLWHASVLDPWDKNAHAVAEFNRRLFASEAFFTTLIPIRDGVSVAVKL